MSNLKEFNLVIRNQNTQAYLQDVLGEKKETFVSNLTALVSNDTKLQECKPVTLMYAALTATSLDLPLDKNLGFAYVIPYKNNRERTTEAQFQLGAKGIKQLAIRSGQFIGMNVTDVREGEIAGRNRMTGEMTFNWIEDDEEREKAKVVGYLAWFKLVNGFEKTKYMTVDEIKAHATRYSQTYSSKNDYVRKNSKWSTDFDKMAEKTVMKLLLSKDAPLSVEMQTAFRADQSVQREEGKYIYSDNGNEAAKSKLTELAEDNAEGKNDETEYEEVNETESTESEASDEEVQ